MNVQYLFNSSGQWIAFRVDKYVFNTEGEWIGWLPWTDPDVVDINGSYLGTIYPENRFYRKYFQPYKGYPGYPGYPGFKGYAPLPAGTEDLKDLQVV